MAIEYLGERLLQVRKHLEMSREAFSACTGLPASTLKKYEASQREPGATALDAIEGTGVNLNWLVSGHGLMMQADQQASDMARGAETVTKPKPSTAINVDALLAALDGVSRNAPAGQGLDKTVRQAVDLYLFMFERGMITLDGVGQVELKGAA